MENFVLLDDFYFDLQLFANPEDEGRTEEPSERKRKKAREEGNVGKSQDLVSALVFLFTFWVIWIMANMIFEGLKNYMISTFKSINSPFSAGNAMQALLAFSIEFWEIVGPCLIAAIFIGVLANLIQVGFMFTPKPIEPKFKKIAFTFEKLKNKVLFSKEMMINLFFSFIKLVILAGIFFVIIKGDSYQLINMGGMGLSQSLGVIGGMVLKLFNAAGIFLLLLSLLDYKFKKKQFEDSLKMKKEEVKREFKEDEGDPMIKGRVKQMYNEFLNRQNIKKTVPQADVIVTNPTHYAVALKYEMEQMQAPMLIAKGEDETALLIRTIAKENNIPIVENPPLARQLYSITEVGDYIPEEFFLTVAEILVRLGKFGKAQEATAEQGSVL